MKGPFDLTRGVIIHRLRITALWCPLQLRYSPSQSPTALFPTWYLLIYVSVFESASSFHQPWQMSPINQPGLEPLPSVYYFLNVTGRMNQWPQDRQLSAHCA